MKNSIDPAFYQEVESLYKDLRRSSGPEDLRHVRKIEAAGLALSALGYLAAPLGLNPVSVLGVALGKFTRWTMMAHHVTHRGYDRIRNVPDRFHSATFARGWNRYFHWNDWIIPQAWDKEHNHYHHYSLGEPDDPDRVEINLGWLRESRLPLWARYIVVFFLSTCWKAIYYAPNTLLAVKIKEEKNPLKKAILQKGPPWRSFMNVFNETMLYSWLPYIGINFIVIPWLFSLINPLWFWPVFWNIFFAEIVTNMHSFFVITPNHAGDDMLHFDGPIRDKREFYWRQVVGSVNYRTGGDVNDFLHGWLNYQIEHHVMPDLTMLQYRKVQPQLKKLCIRYGVPYHQESVFRRIYKTVNVMVGRESNRFVVEGATAQGS